MLIAVDVADLTDTSIDPWHMILALVAVLVGWLFSRVARRSVRKAVERLEGLSSEFRDLVSRITGYVVLFLGFGVALTFLGAQVQPVIATVILFGVILALALRGIAENFAAGILLQTRRPISIGDEIEAVDHEGTVQEMNGRSVVVETFDGQTVHIPNSDVLSKPLVNRTKKGARRSELELRVRRSDVAEMAGRILTLVSSVPGVLDSPAPAAYLRAAESNRLTFLVRFWHLPTSSVSVASAVVEALSTAAMHSGDEVSVITPVPMAPFTPPASI